MKAQTKTENGCLMILVALFLFLLGIVVTIMVPMGIIFGPILIVIGLFTGGKRRKLWVCRSCGYFFERAK